MRQLQRRGNTLMKRSNISDGGNRSQIPTPSKDSPTMDTKDNPTMVHNSSKDMDGNNNLPKDRFVCLIEGDTGNPFHRGV